MSILSNYSNEEFKAIVAQSSSIRDCMKRLGYNSISGSVHQLIKTRIDDLKLDTSHFSKTPVIRTVDNIFIENSTADQSVLRRWYKAGDYTKYECSICGQLPVWNGKELTLILDHINGKNHDDRIGNLRWVCPNCNQQLDTTGSRNIKNTIENNCIDCGKQISKKAIRCITCSAQSHTSTELSFLSRDELKNLIRTTPFTKIGEKYGVSDNAVRKWCDKYNLPKKSSEIKSYSNDQWEKI